jgi:hypothetical protein
MPRRPRLLAAPEYACPVAMWKFAIPVAIGSVAGGVAAFLARKAVHREPDLTQAAVAAVAHAAIFWAVGGTAWVLLSRKPNGYL